MFSGNKDVDYEILYKLDDKELGRICQTDQYFRKLCANDTFWMNRTLRRFGRYLGSVETIKQYLKDYKYTSWRKYYIFLVDSIESIYRLFNKGSYYKSGRNDVNILKTIIENNNEDLEEAVIGETKINEDEVLDNFVTYKWKEILKEDLVYPNFFNYYYPLSNEQSEEFFDYLLSLEKVDPNVALKMLLHNEENETNLIMKILNDSRIQLSKVIKSVIRYNKIINKENFDLYLKYIKDKNGFNQLKEELDKYIDRTDVGKIDHIYNFFDVKKNLYY